MRLRFYVSTSLVLMLTIAASGRQQPTTSIETLRGFFDKMNLRYVSHPKNPDALVVPKSENKYAERLDLYVEIRKDRSLVLTVYPKLRGRYFSLVRVADREKMFQRLLEANHRAFATFFVDPQGDIGTRFTFTTEGGLSYESFRVAVIELLRIADEYTPTLDEQMIKEERKPQSVAVPEKPY